MNGHEVCAWIAAMANLLVAKGVATEKEIQEEKTRCLSRIDQHISAERDRLRELMPGIRFFDELFGGQEIDRESD